MRRLALIVAVLALPALIGPASHAATTAPATARQGAQAQPGADPADPVDLHAARVQWIDHTTVAWPTELGDPAGVHRLVHSPGGALRIEEDGRLAGGGETLSLTRVPGGLDKGQRAKYPHLARGYDAYRLAAHAAAKAPRVLRGQVVATVGGRKPSAATGVQIPGVLDDLYAHAATRARLGPTFEGRSATLAVWAPSARRVALEIGGRTVRMRRGAADGVWRAHGPAERWRNAAYRYRVTVWAPTVQKTVTNEVTDPYSTALTTDSVRSVAADLDDPRLKPPGWDRLAKPAARPARDASVQELHIRDFSASDPTSRHPGTYRAFTDRDSDGMRHLRRLARAGTSHVHLLPAFDFSTVPERRTDQQRPGCDLSSYAPDSEEQQKCVGAAAGRDAYNWGYDPQHYTVPEGSYASDAEGPGRTREFRGMVGGIAGAGLRTVMDVVYNHTSAAGQDERSVLDRIVPGYYQRLQADGTVADSTCCANTAPEHAMMGKLTVDSVVTWARDYKVDGFRFDLMGHHPKANILAVRRALDRLTRHGDGVDGKSVLLYGEGWNFGEVADDARFTQATQRNMAGTGIATFSDRARDAVRGGGPFDGDPRVQGFASGLWNEPNGSPANGSRAEQRARLLHYQDLIKVGLSGNLAAYRFTDSRGRRVTGAGVDYGGQPAGYAAAPGDALAYADAHDNETLYDALAFKLPASLPAADRARMQVVALATGVLSQGPSLSQAGTDLLRSKSLDRNSFDSGDWFNALHWDCRRGNGFGRGLPPADDNAPKWPYARPLLTSPQLKPTCAETGATSAAYRDLLRIRGSEPAFSQPDTGAVQRALSFPLSGVSETPGAVTARLDDLVLVLNASPRAVSQRVGELAGERYAVHPLHRDPVTRRAGYDAKTGTFTVPARTVAVFRRG
ncbi:pullulanase-type alpha-1,6-glucosidase [Streptomyces iconiensis]|uniref:Pullulanase-type alpha-1,6-glucosidase n=1 Tax=Streptomyces iconiensis TaxID=1384038 RepID=A0ABT7A7V0_9ACTN|nr:pullulanase-type alpha-1,6-glucosidase [Streptomyces iconiensis]MDJ1137419.1 pullulanase-type alpha-1,6-glucosidase [Streptomyces iconiensis]